MCTKKSTVITSDENVLDCDVKVYSGESYHNQDRFKVANVLQLASDKQWLTHDYYPGQFILNLGCSDDSYSSVELVNVFGHGRATNRFKVYLR